MTASEVKRGATISPDGAYRYDLTRLWGEGGLHLWVMLNPSTADAEVDDPTIRRCVAFSRADGAGGIVVVNLFALRATDPSALLVHPDPTGPVNASIVRQWFGCEHVTRVVCAWGAWQSQPTKGMQLARLHIEGRSFAGDRQLHCLGRTKSGAPRHPLYVRGDQPFEVYP